jgi:hypothetical protein
MTVREKQATGKDNRYLWTNSPGGVVAGTVWKVIGLPELGWWSILTRGATKGSLNIVRSRDATGHPAIVEVVRQRFYIRVDEILYGTRHQVAIGSAATGAIAEKPELVPDIASAETAQRWVGRV